ncbi:MAG: hypothetical protein FD188_3434 [Ignavibacteria bacterium]|nr:MAG: hypothetical protein FD188_3434 [Ignavibacteria bacterium]
MDNGQEAFYFNVYQQRGGAAPIFKGARFIQYGNGFGDVLRSTTRHVLSVPRTEAPAKIEEPSPTISTPRKQKGKGKKRKKKRVSITRTTLYKAPKKSRKRKKRKSKKNNSKLRKFNF